MEDIVRKLLIGGGALVTIGGISFSVFGGFSVFNITLFGDEPSTTPTDTISIVSPNTKPQTTTLPEITTLDILETTVSDEIPVISDNIITGTLDEYTTTRKFQYEAKATGKYRFDLDINDVNYSYCFAIYDDKNQQLGYAYSDNDGLTIELEENKIYTMYVEQYSGSCEFTVYIGEPRPLQYITDSKFTGNIYYENQTDVFSFTAPNNGKYRFDFDINDVNKSYKFSIYDSKNANVGTDYSYNGGTTVELIENNTYTIYIEQNNGMCEYEVTIGYPSSTQIIDGVSFSGELTYTDQQNYYEFTSKNAGIYRFDFVTNDVNNKYKFTLKDGKNKNLGQETSSYGGITLDLDKNTKYAICIEQITGFSKYTVNIGMPKAAKEITENKISGEITYKDQTDIYTYTPQNPGKYQFDLAIDNVNHK